MEQEHKRRVRYAGTHPRTFQEKYKELNPEKIPARGGEAPAQRENPCRDAISRSVSRKSSPFLEIQPGQIGLDATLGYGGHSRRMLEALRGKGHLYATDVDPIESEKTRQRLEQAGYGPEILTIRQMNFSQLDQVAPGVLFDFCPGRSWGFLHAD